MNQWRQQWRNVLVIGLIAGWLVLCQWAFSQPPPGKEVALIVLKLVGAVFFGVLAGSWREAARSPCVPLFLFGAATWLNSLIQFAFPLPMGPAGLYLGSARLLVLTLPFIVWTFWSLWVGKRDKQPGQSA
jgi:hypothetical protein